MIEYSFISFNHTSYLSQAPQAVLVEKNCHVEKFSTVMWRNSPHNKCHVEKYLHRANVEKNLPCFSTLEMWIQVSFVTIYAF